ncbi:MAG: phosphoribosylanthranilate isomerase [Mucilaginibacter sp.]|uniref:phosphoribosylanthranilate isomerase n=1 Tax=Mucilaginibacter sp. TaxID=1882438 RepID=UPI003263DBBE
MKIKVCGLRNPGNIEAIAELKPDYMGFICYDKSPRYVSETLAQALRNVPDGVTKTAVFVNESKEKIGQHIANFGFNSIQLHGDESPDFCTYFRDKVEVIKAFGIDDSFDFTKLDDYTNSVDLFLFDTKTVGYGGSGKAFNWDVINKYTLNKPFFLSGGISLDNLEQIKQIKHPAFYGVDLNSKFEIEPGLKDVQKLEQAFKILRS